MFVYFSHCTTIEEARAAFRDLCKQHHPDTGGSAEAFRAVVEEFQAFQKAAFDQGGRAKWGESYEPKADSHDLPDDTMDKLRAVLRFPDVSTEILGTWIWCTGETRQYREQFKALAFRWSHGKGAWFYHHGPYRRRGKRGYTLDNIRDLHGQRTFEQEPDQAMPA